MQRILAGCGFRRLERAIEDGKIRVLVAGRDLYEGRGEQKAACAPEAM